MLLYINGKRHTAKNVNPAQTVLQYVRSIGLTGSKLGCQEGGCGACTMTVAEWSPEAKKAKYYAINGCLVPLIALEGKHLITVEGIGTSEDMHPAQERIAKFHGSQCGFCTPGIVMSLYSLLRTNSQPSKEEISEAFDGNLCRCTGYKPIIDAAYTFSKPGKEPEGCAMGNKCCKLQKNQDGPNGTANGATGSNGVNGTTHGRANEESSIFTQASEGDAPERGPGDAPGLLEGEIDFTTPNGLPLKKYKPKLDLAFPEELKAHKMQTFKVEYDDTLFYRPTTLDELYALKGQHPGVKFIGGASEVQIEQKIRGDEHAVCAFINDIPALKTFEHVQGEGVWFGANLSLSDLEHKLETLAAKIGPDRSQTYMAIANQLKYFAGRQVRNCATPAGNIATASPIADLNPILVAANAKLVVWDAGTEREFLMGDASNPFFTGYRKTLVPPGSVLCRVFVPETKAGEIVQAFKQAKRKDDDISIVTAAMRATVSPAGQVEQCTLVYGGVAPITVLAKTSALLVGRELNDELLAKVLKGLDAEFQLPYGVPGGMAVFRRSLILSFFYIFYQRLQQRLGNSFDEAALGEVTRGFATGSREIENRFEERVVGKSDMHLSAQKQVTGEAIYVDDMPPFHNELHCVQVLSAKPHAKILSVDYSKALELEGVEGYVDVNDVTGSNRYGIFPDIGPDRYFCEDNTVLYPGDCIGAICATTQEIAQKAARLVKVEYEELPHITTIEQAIEAKSFFDIHPIIEKGDPEHHLANSEYYFEGSSRMGAQEHFYLEPQGAIVVPEEGQEYKVYSSSQNPTESQLLAARVLGVPASRIVCRVKRLGGGFGGKETRCCHYSGIAAVAARKFRKPVRIIPSRYDDMLQAGQRHPFLAKWRVALDKDYKFTAYHVDLYANAGYSMDLTKGVMDRAVLHAHNCYDFKNCYIKAWPCQTNTASNTAFRGFGGPQGMFSAESIIYTVAERLGIDYELLRERNYFPLEGGVTPYKQNIGQDFTVPIMAKQLKERFGYEEARKEVDEFNKKSKWIKRGLAHVPTKFGVAFGALFLNQAGALVHIYEDGSVLLSHGGTEMGQGLHTKMSMICAEELGVELDNVFISETSTQVVANTSASAASASSDLNGMAVKNACDQLNERLRPYREKLGKDVPMSKLAHACYFDRVNLSANGFYKTPDIGYVFGDPNPKPAFFYYTQGCAIALVEVNTLTGDWANLRTDIIMDIGRPINKAIDYGQIEGAFVQGQGLFAMEESLWFQNGSLFTRGPGNYKIPGFRDIPQDFNVQMLADRDFSHLKTIHRSKGIGEPPLFLGSSVMFAVRDAIKTARAERGLAMDTHIEAPLTTERIRVAVGDDLVERAQVKIEGKPFLIRA